MAHKAPGKSFRKGLSLVDITRMFPDNETAERWFIETRWPDGPRCPHCDSDRVQYPIGHKTMTHRCKANGCRKRFSVRTGTVMVSTIIRAITRRQKAILRRRGPIRTRLCRSFAVGSGMSIC